MHTEEVRLPKHLVWTVVVLSALPVLLKLLGVDFSASGAPAGAATGRPPWFDETGVLPGRHVSGHFVHTLLEAGAVSIALLTAVFAFFHFLVGRDITTPIIGTAWFFSGMIDIFHTLAASGLIGTVEDGIRFIPFTWAISRTFNVCILIAGVVPFLWSVRRAGGVNSRVMRPVHTGRSARQAGTATRPRRLRGEEFRHILLVGILFGLMAYAIIHICAGRQLPKAIFPDHLVPRPWDSIPLVLYLFAGGIIFPRFYRVQANLFSHSLIISVIPHVAAQAHAAFGSRMLFDADFNIAHVLKILAYLVPLAGLILDYGRAYQTEATLRATEEQLRVARNIQQGLFPQRPPQPAGFDFAGASYPAEAVGGDYYDAIPMQAGRLGIVVADVSGHELGASLLMAQTRAYLRALAETHSDVGEIVTRLNRFLLQDVRDRMFVSLFFMRLDPARAAFVYSAAGHEGYLLAGDGKTSTLSTVSPLLGVLDEGPIPCGPETTLKPDDILMLLTDGVVEAESPSGHQFGLGRALGIVAANREKRSGQIVEMLSQAVRTFREDAPQQDDMTIVVLKRNQPKQ